VSDILYLTGAREGGFVPGKMQRGGGEGDEGGVGEGGNASTTAGGFVPGEYVCPTHLMLFTCSSLVGGTLHATHFEFSFSTNPHHLARWITQYGVATISRLLGIIGFFCKRVL